jgi:hypothetical protein
MDTRFSQPSANAHEKQVYVTSSDENIDATMPMVSVSAKPLTGPLASQKRIAAVRKLGDVRVENRAERFSVRGIDRHTKRFALFNFIPKPFVYQNIRVHRDSQAENKASNAGKCQDAVEHA